LFEGSSFWFLFFPHNLAPLPMLLSTSLWYSLAMNYTNLSAYTSYKLHSPLKISVAVSDLNVVASALLGELLFWTRIALCFCFGGVCMYCRQYQFSYENNDSCYQGKCWWNWPSCVVSGHPVGKLERTAMGLQPRYGDQAVAGNVADKSWTRNCLFRFYFECMNNVLCMVVFGNAVETVFF
jgi:hypothetical protein